MRNFYIVRIDDGEEPILTPLLDTSRIIDTLDYLRDAQRDPPSRIFLLETTKTNAWMYSAERAIRELEKET